MKILRAFYWSGAPVDVRSDARGPLLLADSVEEVLQQIEVDLASRLRA